MPEWIFSRRQECFGCERNFSLHHRSGDWQAADNSHDHWGTENFSISFAPNGLLYGLGNGDGNLYLINPQTATATFIGSGGLGIFGLEFGPGGILYGCGVELYQIDPNTGAAADLGRLASGPVALFDDLDFAPNGVMYGVRII